MAKEGIENFRFDPNLNNKINFMATGILRSEC
jgi:hypothetical protein